MGFQKVKNAKKSPIYLFYKIVVNGPDGTLGDDRDIHYCCFHGSHKVCIIKKSMRSNLNGMFYTSVPYTVLYTDAFVTSC